MSVATKVIFILWVIVFCHPELIMISGTHIRQYFLLTGFMAEPPLQRKKKPIPLVTTSTTKMFDEDIVVPDDYMLLGSQEKFSDNVQYKDYLTKNRTRVLGTTYVVSGTLSSCMLEVWFYIIIILCPLSLL